MFKRLFAAVGVIAALAVLHAAPVAAQQEEWKPNDAPWRDSFFPYFPSLGNNFPLIAMHFEERKAADYFARTPYAGLLSIDIGSGFTGARMAVARFDAPLLKKDWRLSATLGTRRCTSGPKPLPTVARPRTRLAALTRAMHYPFTTRAAPWPPPNRPSG